MKRGDFLVDTFRFLRREAGFGDFEVPPWVNTVAELLDHLGDQTNFLFTDEKGDTLSPDIELTLNHKDIAFFPERLETPLNEGDRLDINLTPLGGG